MTWNPGYPQSSQSPALWPSQSQGNNGRLETMFQAEHQFNNSAAANDGVHKQMTTVSRADPTSLPSGTNGMIYEGNDTLPRFYDGVSIFVMQPVRAYLTWDNGGTLQGKNFNATISAPSSGVYTVTFTNPLPTPNFQFSLNCLTGADSNPYIGKILSLVAGTGTQVAGLTLRFVNTTNGQTAPSITFGSLIIFGG